MSESKVPACITSRIKPKKKKLRVSNKPKAKPREKSFDELAREYERSRRTR